MRKAALVVLVIGGIAMLPVNLLAYLKLGVQVAGRTVVAHWNTMPVRYFVTNAGTTNVTAGQFQTAIAAAFSTWEQVPTSTFSASFSGFTPARPLDQDGMSVLGYANRPDLDRVLGATTFVVNTTSGEIVESDIFFNSAFPWSTAQGGESGRYDLQSIALHEIGHLQGLGHSALGETELRAGGGRRVLGSGAVMFPIAFSAGNIEERMLRPDDIAGVSDLYPETDFRTRTGSIGGKVTKNGQGVYGAHVVAFNLQSGEMVGNFSLDTNGTFAIAGLEPGPYALRVEPLDDADVESFFDPPPAPDLAFAPKFFEKIVIAPRGGSAGSVEIAVTPK